MNSSEIEPLKFDTQLFHKQIASYTFSDEHELKKIEKQLSKQSIDLLYLNSSAPVSKTTIQNYLKCTISYIDEKVVFQKKVDAVQSKIIGLTIKTNDWTGSNNPQIESLALASGAFSRFFLDPLINKKHAIELYLIWLKKALSLDLADEVYTSGDDTTSGILTVKFTDNTATVGLLAVDEKFRGQGIAQNLLLHMQNRCIQNRIDTIIIPTQRINKTACDFYFKSGYREISSTYIHHCWKKNG